jgi:hypothetical protein
LAQSAERGEIATSAAGTFHAARDDTAWVSAAGLGAVTVVLPEGVAGRVVVDVVEVLTVDDVADVVVVVCRRSWWRWPDCHGAQPTNVTAAANTYRTVYRRTTTPPMGEIQGTR